MKNPWEEIELSDYENHMKLNSVMQLQYLNLRMKDQFKMHPVTSVMVLGVAGGNGLEHIDTKIIQKAYGVDINSKYLEECAERHKNLGGILECICADLTDEHITLPHADMVIANLLVEYIGYPCFQRVLMQVKPLYVSSVIQINTNGGFVSDSPYIHAFDGLGRVHHQMQEDGLAAALESINYCLEGRKEQALPNGKGFVQLDFRKSNSCGTYG